MKKTILVAAMLSVATSAIAGFQVREMSLNGPGYTNNVQVIPMDAMQEAAKHKLSYNFDEIEFNHQYKAVKHVLDRLPIQQQAKVNLFWHNALIEQELAPKTIPIGSVSVKTILEKSPYDTSIIKNAEDLDEFVRYTYTEKLNQTVPVQVIEKEGNIISFSAVNLTDQRISKIRGNLRVMDTVTGQIYVDENVTESGLWFYPKKETEITINMPSRVVGWKEKNSNLAYKFTVTEVQFAGGKKFNADEFYQKVKNSKQVLDPHPFTEI